MLEEAEDYKTLEFKDVIWVDANPQELEKRREIATQYGHTLIIQALGRENVESAPFYIASNGASSSLKKMEQHRIHYPEITETEVVQVKVMKGDDLFQGNEAADRCNVLCIDVQGAECDVLMGMRQQVVRFDCIFVEIYLEPLYSGCTELCVVDMLLYAYGFLRIDTWIKKGEGWGNAFYLNRKLL